MILMPNSHSSCFICFHSCIFEGISVDTFEHAGPNSELPEDFHTASSLKETMLTKVMARSWDPLLFRQALKLLITFSLTSMDEAEGTSMQQPIE